MPPRPSARPVRRIGDRAPRPAIINPDDLKDLDELDNECEDGWAGKGLLFYYNTRCFENEVSLVDFFLFFRSP